MESTMNTINRNNGYINIDEIVCIPPVTSFEELVDNLKTNKEINIISAINNPDRAIQLVISFNYNGEEYFYKYDCPREPYKASPYNELIAACIAEDLSIPHVDYDLAILGGFKGVISKNFRKNNVKYITGKEFLINNHPEGKQDNIAKLNNLEDIWFAIESYYNENPQYQESVGELMKKVVNMFIFDILTGQADRGASNWWFIEYPDSTLDLQPLFDHMRILMLHHISAKERFPSVSSTLLRVDEDTYKYFGDNLEQFLKVSGEEFIQDLYNSLWVISKENLHKIFTRIEKLTEHPMPEELKQFYLHEFSKQLDFIIDTYNEVLSSKYGL